MKETKLSRKRKLPEKQKLTLAQRLMGVPQAHLGHKTLLLDRITLTSPPLENSKPSLRSFVANKLPIHEPLHLPHLSLHSISPKMNPIKLRPLDSPSLPSTPLNPLLQNHPNVDLMQPIDLATSQDHTMMNLEPSMNLKRKRLPCQAIERINASEERTNLTTKSLMERMSKPKMNPTEKQGISEKDMP